MRYLKLCFVLVALMIVPCFCGCSQQIEEPPTSENGVGDPSSEFEKTTPQSSEFDEAAPGKAEL